LSALYYLTYSYKAHYQDLFNVETAALVDSLKIDIPRILGPDETNCSVAPFHQHWGLETETLYAYRTSISTVRAGLNPLV
jgi:hypothetical protein